MYAKLVTVTMITSSIRGRAAEVAFDHNGAGLDKTSVVNCDRLHTVARSSLTRRGRDFRRRHDGQGASAVSYALAC